MPPQTEPFKAVHPNSSIQSSAPKQHHSKQCTQTAPFKTMPPQTEPFKTVHQNSTIQSSAPKQRHSKQCTPNRAIQSSAATNRTIQNSAPQTAPFKAAPPQTEPFKTAPFKIASPITVQPITHDTMPPYQPQSKG